MRRLSHSRASTLRQCARRYAYKYEYLCADPGSPRMHAGLAGHAGFAAFATGNPIGDAVLETWGDERFGGDYAYLTPAFITAVVERVVSEYDWASGGSFELVESTFVHDWGGVQVEGRPDLVERQEGIPIVHDLKFTSSWVTPSWFRRKCFDLDFQLKTYCKAVSEILNEPVNVAQVTAVHIGESALAADTVWDRRTSNRWLSERYLFQQSHLDETPAWYRTAALEIEWRREVAQMSGLGLDAWPMNILNAYGCGKCPYEELCLAAPEVRPGLIQNWTKREED